MGTTHSPQPQQTPVSPVNTGGTTPVNGAPNDQAAAAAARERGRKSGALVPKEWQAVLGSLLPADPNGSPKPKDKPEFRRGAYFLILTGVPGDKETRTYLADAEIDHAYDVALREVAAATIGDKVNFGELRNAIALVREGGDLQQAGLRIIKTLALITEDGKVWLRKDDHGDKSIAAPLNEYAFTKLAGEDEAVKAQQTTCFALVNAIRNPHSAAAGAVAPVKPVPLTEAQTLQLNTVIKQITDKAQAANVDPKAPKATTAAELKSLLATIHNLEVPVRDAVYAYRDKSGQTLLQILGSFLTPGQVEQAIAVLDPIERLAKELYDLRNGIRDHKAPKVTFYDLMYNFLVDHLADEATRKRLLQYAPIMKEYFEVESVEHQRVLMRMMINGRIEPDAVDKLHLAADAGDSNAAIEAIFELGQTPLKLKGLRSDLVFTHRLQDKCNKPVMYSGLLLTPWDLFLKMCGVDPTQTKEAGSIDKQTTTVVEGEKLEPFLPKDRGELDSRLYNPWSKKIATELNSTFYVNDTTVMDALNAFAAEAAKPDVVKLLHRAKESPGPTMANRIQGHNCDVRLKIQRGLSAENIVAAERILGFVTDQATTGVIGGKGTLATDNRGDGKTKISLEQALRETQIAGGSLSQYIHKMADELQTEINRWFHADTKVIAKFDEYKGVVTEDVCKTLRSATGIDRIWPIELLANAFLQISGSTLQTKLQGEFGAKHPEVLEKLGMRPADIDARKTLAEQGQKQTGDKDKDAAQLKQAESEVELAAKVEAFRSPAGELFKGFAHLSAYVADEVLSGLGGKLQAGLAMADTKPAPSGVTAGPAPAPVAEFDVGVKPGGVAHPGEPAPTSFRAFYKKEYGIDPTRHAVEVAKGLGNDRRTAQDVAKLFKVDAADLAAPPPTPEKAEVNATNRTLVGPNFTTETVVGNAKQLWDLIHENGQIQLLRPLLGSTQEEQRLIQMQFRTLSGGIDLAFFLQQHAEQRLNDGALAVGGAGADGKDKRGLVIRGLPAETMAMLELSTKGRVTIETRISSAIASNNMNEVYEAIEKATADERRAILANDALLSKLRGFGDDSYEWNRIYKGLTGESDMFDRLESRAHGRHGFMGGFEGTDEKGMTSDIGEYAKQRKAAITTQVCGTKTPTKEDKAEINARLKAEFQNLADNPSIRAILNDELSGVELSDRQGLVKNAGEADKSASALTEGDMTEDEEKILDDIKHMSKEERAQRRNDPEYINQLHKAIQSQTTWRDAMIALESTEDGGENEDNYSVLERAARSSRQDRSEFVFEEKVVVEALSKLSPSEYQRLRSNPELQQQILFALEGYPALLAQAKQMMSFNAASAEQMTGLTVGSKPDPEKGVYTKEQIEQLAFLKFGAVNRLRAGGQRAWSNLLAAAVAVFNMKLRPEKESHGEEGGGGGGGGEPPTTESKDTKGAPTANPKEGAPTQQTSGNAATSTPAAPDKQDKDKKDPKKADPEDAIENNLRIDIWAQVTTDIQDYTKGFGDQEQADPADRTKRKTLKKEDLANVIQEAVLHHKDPSGLLLTDSTGWSDNEEQIKETLRKASDELLIEEWTTVIQKSPSNGPSLKDKYDGWRTAKTTEQCPMVKDPADPTGSRMIRRPTVGSKEWEAKVAFQTHTLDTSRLFEQHMLRYAGGLSFGTTYTADNSKEVRDNGEWLEWRTILREKIPNLDTKKIATKIEASSDPDAMKILEDPTLRNTLGQLEYDEERYAVDRGKDSNYNMDRLTASGEGLATDNAMTDYRREVMTSVISKGDKPDEYGVITGDETSRISAARDRFNKSDGEFRAAKAAVANVAATLAALLITAVVSILTAGLATGPMAVILLGALTAGASSLASNATKEAIQGTDFDFSNEGLKNIARDTVMGAVTAGTTWYAGKIAAGVFNVSTAAEQTAVVAAIAKAPPSFLVGMGKSMTEMSLQSGMSGVFEAGAAAFDPALWLDGWREGWTRGSAEARKRAEEIPGEMLRAAIIAAVTHGATHVIGDRFSAKGKLKSQIEEAEKHGDLAAKEALEQKLQALEEKEAQGIGHAATGDRAGLGDRAKYVGGKMVHGVGDGIIMAGTELVIDEKSYRGGGHSLDDIISKFGESIVTTMQLAAINISMEDGQKVERIRTGARELHLHGDKLNATEKKLYAEMAMTSGQDSSTLSINEFNRIRTEMIDKELARHKASGGEVTADTRAKFEAHCRNAPTFAEFKARVEAGPTKAPGSTAVEPHPIDFSNRVNQGAESLHAEELLPKLHAAIEANKAQQKAVVGVGPEGFALLQQAGAILSTIPKGSPERAAVVDLVSKLNQAASELKGAVETPGSGGLGLTVLTMELESRIAAAKNSPELKTNPAKVFEQLHKAVIDAEAQQTTSTKTSEQAIADAKKQVEILKDLLVDARLLAESAARHVGVGDTVNDGSTKKVDDTTKKVDVTTKTDENTPDDKKVVDKKVDDKKVDDKKVDDKKVDDKKVTDPTIKDPTKQPPIEDPKLQPVDQAKLAEVAQSLEAELKRKLTAEERARLEELIKTHGLEVGREKFNEEHRSTSTKLTPDEQAKYEWFVAQHGNERGKKLFDKWRTTRFGEAETLTDEQHKAIADRVSKEPGDHIGDTVDKSFLTEEQADIERWQTHGLEDVATDPEAGKVGTDKQKEKSKKQSDTVREWLSDPEFRHWYDVWMSMPDRVVTIEGTTEVKVNIPHGMPAELAKHLEAIALGGNVGLMTRALETAKKIEAHFPGIDPDPESAAWKAARPELVKMLGEDAVTRYEQQSRPEKRSAKQQEEIATRIHELVNPDDLAALQNMLPGAQIYVSGSGAQLSKSAAHVADLDLMIVMPKGTPQAVRIEVEQRLQSMKVRRGSDGKLIPIDAKVMTHEQFMGLAMLEKPAHMNTQMDNLRIDTPHDGPLPGTAESGGDLHNHVMGVPATQYFIDKIGGGSATVTLDKLAHDLTLPKFNDPTKPAITPIVRAQIEAGLRDVAEAKKLKLPVEMIEARARRALDGVFVANEHTPFDHTYDIRDIAVTEHIDTNGKFENYAKDVITDLHDQGVTFSEQSVSMKKLENKFDPETMKKAHERAAAEGKDSKMDFLVMAPTSESLSSNAPELKGTKEEKEQQQKKIKDANSAMDDRLEKVLMRADVKGMDIAGPENAKFTDTGMDWFMDKYRLLEKVAKAKGEKLVLRPHVGEGYDPNGTGEHKAIAEANLRKMCETLEILGYNGSGDVLVRFGHATHATPELMKRMAKLGIIVEANVGSNIATGSVLHAEEHPLLSNMFYGVKTVLATDAQGVMGTTLPIEYQRAAQLLQRFKGIGGEPGAPLVIDGKEIHFNELDAAQKERFSIEWLMQQLAEHKAQSAEKAGTDKKPPPSTDGTGKTSVRAPEPNEQAGADQLKKSTSDLKTAMQDRLGENIEAKLTPPPLDKPVLTQSANDALIGVPTSMISPTGDSQQALEQIKKQGIPRWPGLTEVERKHEEQFASRVEANMETFVDTFLARAQKGDTFTFEVDGAKKLYAEYGWEKNNDEKQMTKEQLEVRATANHALHPTAVLIARLAFMKRLDQMLMLDNNDPLKRVFVTNGGCAAGKGSLFDVAKGIDSSKKFGAVWDAAGEGDGQENGWILAACRARGIKVTFGFVENTPEDNYKGVLERAEKTGRIVDPITYARSYVLGQKHMREFLDSPEYKEAAAAGEVETIGTNFKTKKPLGDKGLITDSSQIPAPPDEAVVTADAIKKLADFLESKKGTPEYELWLQGGATNTQKFAPQETRADVDQGKSQPPPPSRDQRLKELAGDPSHGGAISVKTEREAAVGLALEESGVLKGPIKRDPSGAAEFIDAQGQSWDVKRFNSNFPPKKGGYELKDALKKIQKELDAGEKVIVDTSDMKPEHVDELRAAVTKKGWDAKVVWH